MKGVSGTRYMPSFNFHGRYIWNIQRVIMVSVYEIESVGHQNVKKVGTV